MNTDRGGSKAKLPRIPKPGTDGWQGMEDERSGSDAGSAKVGGPGTNSRTSDLTAVGRRRKTRDRVVMQVVQQLVVLAPNAVGQSWQADTGQSSRAFGSRIHPVAGWHPSLLCVAGGVRCQFSLVPSGWSAYCCRPMSTEVVLTNSINGTFSIDRAGFHPIRSPKLIGRSGEPPRGSPRWLEVMCNQCGQEFLATESQAPEKTPGRFCSRALDGAVLICCEGCETTDSVKIADLEAV
jgi:hypothetical protein